MKTLQISESSARKLYKTGSSEFKQTLEDTFSKEYFTRDVTERIKTMADVYEDQGVEPIDREAMLELGFTEDEITYRELKLMTKALNEGWYPDWSDKDEYRWVPWFKASSGFAFCDTRCYCSTAGAGHASRLCFKSSALAEYAGRQFNDLYKAFIQ